MNTERFRIRVFAVLATSAVMAVSAAALADPPSRVARLGYTSGPVSFSPAGENDWFDATINRPLTSGDRLWADDGARAEVQLGGATIRLDAGTGASILNMDDDIAQLRLTQGRLNVRVYRLEPRQVFEVDTPNLAFTLRQPGDYRIEVDPDGSATTVVVRSGRGEAYGEGAAYVIDSRQAYRFAGTGLRDYEYVDVPRFDDFDRWSSDRDRRYEHSDSARYVSEDVVGYQDLDANGTWRVDMNYGNVWVPNRVAAGWAPYRDGHWVWIDPWGWTWVDDAPWGFAVSHYGRWANFGGTWGWVPGPVHVRSYYAPALVVFLGGGNLQLRVSGGNVGGIGWFPLGPRDVYRPSYPVSRRYFEDINSSNTVINNTVINNYYGNSNVTNIVYVNRQVPGAVVVVPRAAFVQSQPVSVASVRVSEQTLASEPVDIAPRVAPTERSVHGAVARRDRPPPSQVFERPVVARSVPPPAHVGFAAQQPQLNANPGKPLDETTRRQLQRGTAVPAPVVNVIAHAPEVPTSTIPPPSSPAQGQGGKHGQQGKGGQHAQPVEPTPAAPPAAAPPVEAASPPPSQAPEQGGRYNQPGKSGQQGKGGQHAPPVEPTPAAPPAVAPPVEAASPAQGTPPASAVSEPGTPEPVPATDKKKNKKKPADQPDQPTPEEDGTQTQ